MKKQVLFLAIFCSLGFGLLYVLLKPTSKADSYEMLDADQDPNSTTNPNPTPNPTPNPKPNPKPNPTPNPKPNPTPNPKPNSDRLVTIVYHQKKYRLKQGFTLDSGMKSGGALWRFKNNQWEKAANPDNPTWIRATDQDITFLLKIHATEITSVPPNVGTVTEEHTVPTDHSLSSDQYWKGKIALTTTEDGLNRLKSQACDIRKEYNKGSQGLSDISKIWRSKIYEIIRNVCP